MPLPARKRVVVLTAALDRADHVVDVLRARYEVSSVALAELPTSFTKLTRPDAFVAAAELRSDIRKFDGQANPQLVERVLSGRMSMPVVLLATSHQIEPFVAQSNLRVLSTPFADNELLDAVELALAQKKYNRRVALRTAVPPVLVFLAFLVAWESACRVFGVREFVLPPPTKIFAVTMSNMRSLLFDTALTTFEALLGFLLANVLSLGLAVGFCHHRWMETSLYPYTIALKSVPVVAVAPLLVLWFGYGLLGKVVMAAIIAFFPLVVNATLGLKAVNTESLDLMCSLSATKWQILTKLRFPTAIPYIVSALKISSAMAVVGAIVGELAGATRGIGYVILISSYNLDTPMLFSAIALASIIGILFFAGIALLEMLFFRKYY